MKWRAPFLTFVLCLLLPGIGSAQSLGRVECPRQDGYVYLYSSMVTLDVRTTLYCGEQVEITGRYDGFYGVSTSKGVTGFVPLEAIVLLKAQPGAKPAPLRAEETAREKISYDDPNAHTLSALSASAQNQGPVLLDGTPVHLKFAKTISSAGAHVGDEEAFEVTEEVVVGGLTVISKGAAAIGVVAEVAPKGLLGRDGKLSIGLTYVRLTDDEKAGLRAVKENKSELHAGGVIFPLKHGKDITFAQGTAITAFVNGDKRLTAAKFSAAKKSSEPAPSNSAASAPHPQN
jgi:hypothetical protein